MTNRLFVAALVLAACDDAPVAQFPDFVGLDAGDASTLDASLGLDGAVFLEEPDAMADTRDASVLPYARNVVSFRAGANAGFGQNKYPGVVLGPPVGKGPGAGGLDVLSLGVGGELVVDFGTKLISDGAGPDFIVFENAFLAGGSSQAAVFAEPGEVSVSNDLTTWQTFPCSLTPRSPGVYPGCAGWTPTLVFDPFDVVPLDPAKTGGDAFDLATVSLPSARYVRIRDLSTSGQGDNAGFDLDAIGVIHTAQTSPTP